jgi:hypothetical protein
MTVETDMIIVPSIDDRDDQQYAWKKHPVLREFARKLDEGVEHFDEPDIPAMFKTLDEAISALERRMAIYEAEVTLARARNALLNSIAERLEREAENDDDDLESRLH